MSIKCSEISTYEKMHYELKNFQNILGILLKTILKFGNYRFYKNFYAKNCRILKFLIYCLGVCGGKKTLKYI